MPCEDPNCGRQNPHDHGDYTTEAMLVLQEGITVEDLLKAGERQACDDQLRAIAAKARRQ